MSDALKPNDTFSTVSTCIAALRPVSGPEIVDEGIQLARQNYIALLMAACVPLVPPLGMRIWTSSHRMAGLWATLFLMFFNAVWGSLASAAGARVAMDALEGSSADPARAQRIVLRRAWPVVLSGLYRAVFALLGLVLLVIPGLYVLSVYALASVLPTLEPGPGGWQALRRSAALTAGARWLAFGTYVAPYYFSAGASVVLSLLTARLLGANSIGRMASALVAWSVVLTAAPFIASIQVRLYVELRMRKEAFDIEWALASASPEAVA